MTNLQVLALPKRAKLSVEEKAALREAGIIVIHVDDPRSARLLTADPFPVTASALARAAIHGLNNADICTDKAKNAAWDALVKSMQGEEP